MPGRPPCFSTARVKGRGGLVWGFTEADASLNALPPARQVQNMHKFPGQRGVRWYVHPGSDALQQEVRAAQYHLAARGALGIHEAGCSFCDSSGWKHRE